MSLASTVHDVFAANASVFGDTLQYRVLVSNAWGSFTNCVGEIKETSVAWEYDDKTAERVRRERCVAKLYDQTSTVAPTLRLGDQIKDASAKYWTVDSIRKADIGNGIFRYGLVRDLPIRAEADRGGMAAEGGTVAATGPIMSSFSALNEEASATIFVGALVHKTATGMTLARNDLASKDAIGICTIAAAAGETGTVVTENAITLTDWTAIMGSTTLTEGADYWLAATAGKMTATPNTTGYGVQFIGTAIDTHTLDLRIAPMVRL